jgi:hypothetical protein
MQFSSHQELTTMDQPGQTRRLPSEQDSKHCCSSNPSRVQCMQGVHYRWVLAMCEGEQT